MANGNSRGHAQDAVTGSVLCLAGAALWGTSGTAQALAPPGASPTTVGAARIAVGGLALLALALARGSFRGLAPWPRGAVGVAVVSTAAYQVLFFNGVALTGVAVGTIVGIGSAPIMGGLLARLVRGEPFTRVWGAATALAVPGSALLVLTGGETATVDPLGVLLSLGAGLSFAIFTLAGKRLLEDRPADAVTAVTFTGATLLLAPVFLVHDATWIRAPRGAAVALHLGVLATALAYILYARGLHRVPAANAVTFALMEPATAGVLGVLVLGERLEAWGLVGVGLVLAGLMVLTLGARRATPARA